ncbi:MAG: hypothetical protein ACR2O3_18140, partial [Rhizobiaceae bacterium]
MLVSTVSLTVSNAQTALTADVRTALSRLKNDTATEADRAILFANNDAIQAAGQNGSLSKADYLKAQNDYSLLNEEFGRGAARDAKADFVVQTPSSDNPIPGTDSDYITTVTSKDQIPVMQDSYNKQVNEYLKKIPEDKRPKPRTNWHNKLDVDFMADPNSITSPEEFREIAKLNNDAYKNRYAAEYERLSRANDGSKIGPEHVNGYMDEMNDFAQKKGRKVDDILSKPPSHLSDPKNRAELFQAMAQEQKYTSRMESLDDFLRTQEGLPPRNRGTTISKLGSNRSASNSANIRNANAVADSSRFAALEDLAETMGEVSKKNPHFNVNAADDIAKIVESLPPGRRADALRKVSASAGPGMIDDIVRASGKAGRLPPGAGSLADDLVRFNTDDLGRLVSNVDDVSDVARARSVMASAMNTLDAIGKVATGAEAALAVYQMREVFLIREQLLNPNLSDAVRERLIAKESELTGNLAESVGLTIITELSPHIAIAYGTWTIGCMAGEYRSATREGSNLTCGDRQLAAADHALDWLSGKHASDELQARRRCNQFKTAVREKRVRLRPGYTEEEVCGYIRYGNSIAGTFEHVPEEEQAALLQPKLSPLSLAPASCNFDQNQSIVANLGEAASSGRPEALAHIAMLNAVNEKLAKVSAVGQVAKQAYTDGNLEVARTNLNNAKALIGGLPGSVSCPQKSQKIDAGLSKIDRLTRILDSVTGAIEGCAQGELYAVVSKYGSSTNKQIQNHLDGAKVLLTSYSQLELAKASLSGGSLQLAKSEIAQAENSLSSRKGNYCPSLREDIASAENQIDKLREAVRLGEQALATCDPKRINKEKAALSNVVNPAAAAIKSRLENG